MKTSLTPIHRTLKIGLTGGIGSGKSSACGFFAELGAECIKLDDINRSLVKKGSNALAQIAEKFGPDVISAEGNLDRAALRYAIFEADNANSNKQWLEDLLHPLIKDELNHQIDNSHSAYVIVESPLLFEVNSEAEYDYVVVVDIAANAQVERASIRDQHSKQSIEAIMKQQLSSAQRVAKADFVLNNNGDINDLKQQVTSLHHQLLTLKKAH